MTSHQHLQVFARRNSLPEGYGFILIFQKGTWRWFFLPSQSWVHMELFLFSYPYLLCHICLVLRTPDLDAVLQVGSHEGRIENNNNKNIECIATAIILRGFFATVMSLYFKWLNKLFKYNWTALNCTPRKWGSCNYFFLLFFLISIELHSLFQPDLTRKPESWVGMDLTVTSRSNFPALGRDTFH